MRVTDQQIYSNLSSQVRTNWSRLARAQERAATGKEVLRPSDNPLAADRIGALQESLAKLDDSDRAGKNAAASLEAVESATGQASDLLIRARELAVQSASEQYGAEDRAAAALEIRQLQKSLVAIGNTRVADRYVFGGYLSDRPPFQADGTFVGDSGEPELEVAPGLMVATTVRADETFSGAGGGVDLFAALDTLATAMETNSSPGIQASLDTLDQGLSQLLQARSRAGSRLSTVSAAANWNERLRVGLETDVSKISDADLARASMDLALAQQALEATLATVPKMVGESILDRL